MKKISFATSFLVIALVFLGYASSARADFKWEYYEKSNDPIVLKSVCYNTGVQRNASYCDGLTKLPEKTGYNTACCFFNPEANAQKTAEVKKAIENLAANNNLAEPKFVLPTFQIKIPGLDSLSKPTCYINEEGQRSCGISWISEYIFAIYKYGLTIVGVLAVLMLMVAGLLWIVSGGDSGKITSAKKIIFGSITGLLLMVSANLILTYINPDLVKKKTLALSYIEDIEPESNVGNEDNSTDCKGCKATTGIVASKSNAVGTMLNSEILDKLKKASDAYKAASGGKKYFVITEAYPPRNQHKSKCHYNGMCTDIAIRPQGGMSCTDVKNLVNQLTSAGLKVLNEYVSCSGTKTTYTTGGHMHVY